MTCDLSVGFSCLRSFDCCERPAAIDEREPDLLRRAGKMMMIWLLHSRLPGMILAVCRRFRLPTAPGRITPAADKTERPCLPSRDGSYRLFAVRRIFLAFLPTGWEPVRLARPRSQPSPGPTLSDSVEQPRRCIISRGVVAASRRSKMEGGVVRSGELMLCGWSSC